MLYEVSVIETYRRTVKVYAGSAQQAMNIVEKRWKNSDDTVLCRQASDFDDVDYMAKEIRDAV